MQPRTQPLAQALPFSLGGALRDAGLRVPVIKMSTGWEGLQRTLKEVAYILLCCWYIKELLDKGQQELPRLSSLAPRRASLRCAVGTDTGGLAEARVAQLPWGDSGTSCSPTRRGWRE
ncbi:lens epithelial cell protein LEP503 [Heterocephalus glaber]|uniref:Lens epithelial cell protein LEP503 n=1 Tax=Heterocephalus glaber TaxID=10181 RepID=A0AAX6QD25_HETGA|nr:lens epithelial cell protein LEP503 [Heterocephalus glaber]